MSGLSVMGNVRIFLTTTKEFQKIQFVSVLCYVSDILKNMLRQLIAILNNILSLLQRKIFKTCKR